MKALVTGASGFVGRHLVEHLLDHGDSVVATDRSTGLDICDAEAVRERFSDERPNVVYHLAGDSDVGGSWNHPRETFRVNAEGTLNVMAAARDIGIERVISIGSADVYGKVEPHDLPLTEQSPLRPTSPYAASKVAADFLALQATLGYGLDVIRVRPFNHIGPGQSERFVAPALAMRIARNEIEGAAVVPVGNLTPKRDLTDVRDVVRAYRLLALDGHPGEVYNVCSGVAVSIDTLAQLLVERANLPMQLEPDPDLMRPVDVPILLGDFTHLREATGWTPSIALEVTLTDLLADCRSRAEAERLRPSI